MGIVEHRVPVTTDSGGAATGKTQGPVTGKVEQITYTPDGTNPLATGADVAIVGEASALNVFTKADIGTSAFVVAPRQATHSNTDGSAALYAAAGTAVRDKIALSGERLVVTIAQGGNTKSGEFVIFVDDRR